MDIIRKDNTILKDSYWQLGIDYTKVYIVIWIHILKSSGIPTR